MTIYLDTAFLVNTLLDGALLLATSKVTGRPCRRFRLLLSALCGGLYATATLMVPLLGHLVCQLAMAVFLVLISSGKSPGFLKEIFCYLAISAAFSGFVYLICQVFSTGLVLVGAYVYYPISLAGLLVTAAACYLVAHLCLRALAQHTGQSLHPVVIGNLRFTALVDTGNTLRDPATNQPILVVHWKTIADLLPIALIQKDWDDPVALFTRLSPTAPGAYRLVPYGAIGVSHGLLLVKRCHLTIGAHTHKNGLVAFSPTALSESGTYQALTGPL